MKKIASVFLTAFCSLLFSDSLLACSVCFGDPNSQTSKALIPAVLLLGGTITFVLGGIATLTLIWVRRAKKLYGENYQKY